MQGAWSPSRSWHRTQNKGSSGNRQEGMYVSNYQGAIVSTYSWLGVCRESLRKGRGAGIPRGTGTVRPASQRTWTEKQFGDQNGECGGCHNASLSSLWKHPTLTKENLENDLKTGKKLLPHNHSNAITFTTWVDCLSLLSLHV